MTIIVATPDIMLADSQTRWGNCLTTNPYKVQRFGTDIVGVSGDWGLSDTFFASWTVTGPLVPCTAPADRSVDALVIRDHGLYWADHMSQRLHPLAEPVWAIGSGMFMALGAIWAGASLIDAMAIVCTRGSDCGWPVRWYSISGEDGIVTQVDWQNRDIPSVLLVQPFPDIPLMSTTLPLLDTPKEQYYGG